MTCLQAGSARAPAASHIFPTRGPSAHAFRPATSPPGVSYMSPTQISPKGSVLKGSRSGSRRALRAEASVGH
jgi:hypothetical protein